MHNKPLNKGKIEDYNPAISVFYKGSIIKIRSGFLT